jgi:hypothetical protein
MWQAASGYPGDSMNRLRHCVLAASLLLASGTQAAELFFGFEDPVLEFTEKTEPPGVRLSVDGDFARYEGIYTPADGFLLLEGQALEIDEGATLTILFPAETFASVSRVELDIWLPVDLEQFGPPIVELFDGTGNPLNWHEPVPEEGRERHYAYFGTDARSVSIRFDAFTGLPEEFPDFPRVALDNLQANVELVPAPVPEPSTYLLTAAGLLLLGALTKRRRRK